LMMPKAQASNTPKIHEKYHTISPPSCLKVIFAKSFNTMFEARQLGEGLEAGKPESLKADNFNYDNTMDFCIFRSASFQR